MIKKYSIICCCIAEVLYICNANEPMTPTKNIQEKGIPGGELSIIGVVCTPAGSVPINPKTV
jgi:hypothetical protein